MRENYIESKLKKIINDLHDIIAYSQKQEMLKEKEKEKLNNIIFDKVTLKEVLIEMMREKEYSRILFKGNIQGIEFNIRLYLPVFKNNKTKEIEIIDL